MILASEQLEGVVITIAMTFIAIFFRYVGLAYLFDWIFHREHFSSRKVHDKPRKQTQKYREITWSAITSFIFAVFAGLLYYCWQEGMLKIYHDIGQYGMGYFFFSLVLYFSLHETYYYWVHRWMHTPKIYRFVHKVHHESITTSTWTSFSFHPIESLLQAVFIPILLFFIPIHDVALGILLAVMTISSMVNHLNIEIYPHKFEEHWLGKWLIGATHHSLHHTQFKYNFGLYFTFWDKLMKTESPQYVSTFKDKTQPTPHEVANKT